MFRFLIISFLFICNLFFSIDSSYASEESYEFTFKLGYRVNEKLILSKDSADWKTTVWIYDKGDDVPGLKVQSNNYNQIYITGKPEKNGTYKITYKKPGLFYDDHANIVIHIDEEHLNINPDHLKIAQVGKPYYEELDVSGGMGPYTWSADHLPEGLSINNYGEISGTPKKQFNGFVNFTVTDAIGTNNFVSLYLSVVPVDLAIITEKLPASRIGNAYHYLMESSGGSEPYHWSADGLPVGLGISQDGVISGTPAENFEGDISISVRDYYGNKATKRLGLQIAATDLLITTSDLPSGKVGVAYQYQLSGTGGSVPYQWSAEGLPAGLQLTSEGVISGVPKESFAGDVILQMTDGKAGKATKRINLQIAATDLLITTADLPFGKVGVVYRHQLSGTGGSAPYHWSAEGLPAGLQLTSEGVINGTPKESFAGDVTLQVTDGKASKAIKRLGLYIAATDLVITTADLPSGKVGVAYQYQLSGTGGSAPYHWSAERLPAGLQLTSEGVISGTPKESFAGDVILQMTDDRASKATKRISLQIAADDLVITTSDLPSGKVGVAYQYQLSGTGGSAPYHWSAEGLPAGLRLTSDGVISGTPKESFAGNVRIQLMDNTGVTTRQNQSLLIAGLPLFKAQDHHLVIVQGTTGSVDLAGKASGAVVTSASIMTHDLQSGRAWIEHEKNTQILFFAASPNFSGKTVISYRLISGDRVSNVARVSIDVVARPDPATDQDVIGLVNAQAQSATRMAQIQNRNFQQRLEQLSDADECLQDSIGLSIGLDGAKLEPKLPTSKVCSQRNYALWSAGEIGLGKSSNGEASKSMKHNSIGVSGGIDYCVNSSFIAGLGIGYGKDTADIGNNGTKNRATQLALVTYGSYRPDENVFVNALLGYGWLSFQSNRHVVLTGQKALGERNGHQIFGSLALGYTFRQENWLLSPYLKGDVAFSRLASFTEKGAGLYNLRYDRQSANMRSLTLGLRGEYIVPTTWGELKTKARVEYVHDFSGSSRSRLGYSDMGDLMPFVIDAASDKKDHLRFELGLDTYIMNDWMAGIGYSSKISTSGGTPEHGFKWKLSKGF